jgi:exopolysaccharide biosynthesis polyprenyl glycosylphosphotransferase
LAQQILSTPPVAANVSVPHKYSQSWAIAMLFLDIAMFVLATYAAIHIVGHWKPDAFKAKVYFSAAAFITIWILVFKLVGLYERSFALSMKDEFYCTVAALCVGIAPQLVLFTLVPLPLIASSRLVLIVSLLLSIVAVGSTRAITHALRDAELRRRPQRIAIVGQPSRIETAIRSLGIAAGDQVRTFEVVDVDAGLGQINLTEDPELDNIAWFHAAKLWNCDTLILTEVVHPDLLPHLLEIAERHSIKIAFAPPRLKRQAFHLSFETNGHQVLIVPRALRACRAPARLIKRIFDLVAASAMLLIFGPLMLIVAGLIWLQRSGPVLYRQQRITRGGAVFDVLKFRTMPCEAEKETGPVWTQPGDKRATRLGSILRRSSLDELPQLFNVLRGEMSLVGPRPERPVFAELFRQLPRYDERHLVCPGITGWSQVQMRRASPLSDIGLKLSHDLYYIENWSIFMDCYVLLKTALEFLFQRPV